MGLYWPNFSLVFLIDLLLFAGVYCIVPVMGVVPLNSVDPLTGRVPVTNVQKNKQTNNNNALRLRFKPISSGMFANSHHLP